MRLAALISLLLCGGCSSSGDALVVVTVSSIGGVTGIESFHVSATANGQTKAFEVSPAGGAAFAIPPSQTFAVDVPPAFTGTFSLTLDAIGAGGQTLASGGDSTTTKTGKESTLDIMLMSGNGDGSDTDANSDGAG